LQSFLPSLIKTPSTTPEPEKSLSTASEEKQTPVRMGWGHRRSGIEKGHGHRESGIEKNQGQAVEEAFQATVYRMQQVSLAVRMQQAAAHVNQSGNGEEATDEIQTEQLTFDFFAQSRVEELVQFTQRTQTLAEGLEGTQQKSLIQVSQQVSARFEFSMSMSGSALTGFANGAEGLQDNETLFADFMDLAQQFLDAADEMFDEFMSMFDGTVTDNFGDFFSDFFQGIMDHLGAAGFFGQGDQGSTAKTTALNFQFQMEFSFEFSAQISGEVVQESDPIVLDLDGDGVELTSHTNGAQFDILGNGSKQRTAFVTGGDAFLALDRNDDGIINSGKELFGDQNGAANGFEELRKLDRNNDGVINRLDPAFSKLVLFRDNGNGLTEEGELLSLDQAGIEEISLGYTNVNEGAAGGNRLGQIASFLGNDGYRGRAADAILNYTI